MKCFTVENFELRNYLILRNVHETWPFSRALCLERFAGQRLADLLLISHDLTPSLR